MFLFILLTYVTLKLDKENLYLPCTVDLFKTDNSLDYTTNLFATNHYNMTQIGKPIIINKELPKLDNLTICVSVSIDVSKAIIQPDEYVTH